MGGGHARMKSLLVFLLAAGLVPAAHGDEKGFISLFNGRDLSGWEGAPGLWSVQNGVIVGSTEVNKTEKNTFLIYKKPFSNFVLRFDIRVPMGNSGVQFRSKVLPDYVVTGYQADAADAGERSAWGNFYEEKGRGRKVMKTTDEGWLKAQGVLRRADWNSYEVFAEGDHIRLTFNGVVTIDTHDSEAKQGVIAIQLHAGPPMRTEVRNIRIKPLRP
jgi:hypothetical protein